VYEQSNRPHDSTQERGGLKYTEPLEGSPALIKQYSLGGGNGPRTWTQEGEKKKGPTEKLVNGIKEKRENKWGGSSSLVEMKSKQLGGTKKSN